MCHLRKSTEHYSYCSVTKKLCSCKNMSRSDEQKCRNNLYEDLCAILKNRIDKDKIPSYGC